MQTIEGAHALDSRKESYRNMNDWLNVLVQKRIATAVRNGEALPSEMAWVAENDHQVYQKRFQPMVWAVLAVSAYGILQTQQPLALLTAFDLVVVSWVVDRIWS